MKTLTFNDLNKDELISIIKCAPLLMSFFNERRIANILIMRKYKEMVALEERLQQLRKIARKRISKKRAGELFVEANVKVKRYNRLANECSKLLERLPLQDVPWAMARSKSKEDDNAR